MHAKTSSSGRRIGALVGTLGLLLTVQACGTSDGDRAATPPPATSEATTTTTTDHLTGLADHETIGIASQLSPVPGYHYEDIPAEEVEQSLAELHEVEDEIEVPGFFRAVSLHSVVADDDAQNTARTASGGYETALLQLYEFSEAPPAGDEGAIVAGAVGLDPVDRFTVAGTDVWVFEDPSSTDSRALLGWMRHGVLGQADGRDRDVVERWVRAYLAVPELEPEEDDLLAAQLVDVEGFAYVNVWDQDLADIVTVVEGAGPVSVHSVTDGDGGVGVLLLAEVEDDLDPTAVEDLVSELSEGRIASSTTIEGTTVATATTVDGLTIWGWSSGRAVHVVMSSVPDRAEAFVGGYLAAG